MQNVTYTFAGKETAALTMPGGLALRATEAVGGDGISSAGHIEETTDIRSGRLLIQNVFGSELVDLAVPMRVQYFVDANTGWVTNTNDACTAVTLTLSNYQGNLAAGETCVQDSGNPGLSGQGCVAAGPSAPVDERFRESTSVGFSGDFNLYLRAPGNTNDGSVDISTDLSAMSWLQFDWDGNGVPDNNPQGRATFGIYKGSPRHIYLRERY
jgi:MSHA biogenesis protein MshQ